MNLILSSKATYSSADCDLVWADPEPYVSEAEARNFLTVAARELRAVVKDHRVGLSWSGGKDSIALELVVAEAGLAGVDGVCGVAAALEVPEALAWYRAHTPPGVTEYDRRDYNLGWLKTHPQYLFPESGADAQVFTTGVTRWSQHQFIDDAKPEFLLHGRRKADGNWFPPANQSAYGIHHARGTMWYSPIRSWPHEAVLAVIRYAGRELPPTYSWPQGWKTGTGPWPGWRFGVEVGRSYLAEVSPAALAAARGAGVL